MSTIIVMRAFIASTVGVTCAAALAVPLVVPLGTGGAVAAPVPRTATAPAEVTGVQSLALAPLATSVRSSGGGEVGLPARETDPFSLLGVVWTDPDAELHGGVEVRTRDAESGTWSGWQPLDTHTDHAPDAGSAEADGGEVRGGTAPLWVGPRTASRCGCGRRAARCRRTGCPRG